METLLAPIVFHWRSPRRCARCSPHTRHHPRALNSTNYFYVPMHPSASRHRQSHQKFEYSDSHPNDRDHRELNSNVCWFHDAVFSVLYKPPSLLLLLSLSFLVNSIFFDIHTDIVPIAHRDSVIYLPFQASTRALSTDSSRCISVNPPCTSSYCIGICIQLIHLVSGQYTI